MTDILISLSLGAAMLVLHVLLSTLLVRTITRHAPVVLHFLSMIISLLVFFAAAAFIAAPIQVWHGAILICVGAVIWVFGFSAVYKSISLEMLKFIDRTGLGKTTIPELQDQFGDTIFDTRVTVLLEMGLIIKDTEGRYEITPKGSQLLKRFSAIRFLFGVRNIGFYG